MITDLGELLRAVAAGSESSLVARGPTSVKCMMEGCRVMVPADSDVCTTCRRKQIEAYEGTSRPSYLLTFHTNITIRLAY